MKDQFNLAKFSINRKGIISSRTGRTAGSSRIEVERHGQILHIGIVGQITPLMLVALIQHIRVVDATISLAKDIPLSSTKLRMSTAEACLAFGGYALHLYERQYRGLFSSQFVSWSQMDKGPIEISQLVSDLATIQLNFKDTPSTLAHLNESQMQPMSFIYPNSNFDLVIGKWPETAVWPKQASVISAPIEDTIPAPFGFWLRIVYETAFAIRVPLLHHGQMMLADETLNPHMRAFQRLLFPISPASEKPANFRLISVAVCLDDQSVIV